MHVTSLSIACIVIECQSRLEKLHEAEANASYVGSVMEERKEIPLWQAH
jgi:hypothetical protein